MKWFMFCVAMNFIAAIVLIGAGATELNNLGTSVPALLCIAGTMVGKEVCCCDSCCSYGG